MVAQHGASDFVVDMFEQHPPQIKDEEGAIGSAVRTASTIQIEDIRQTKRYRDGTMSRRKAADADGIRSTLHVPLIVQDECVGVLALHRQDVGQFPEDVVRLVESFAAQAVIAIENVRQFREVQTANRELTGALERQTATSDVLDVISKSQSDIGPVLEIILQTAKRLCHGERAGIWKVVEGRLDIWAHTDARLFAYFDENPLKPDDESLVNTAVRENRTIHIEDVLEEPADMHRERMKASGTRTVLMVPLTSPGNVPVGAFVISRVVAKKFSPEEVALIETFADQAAIALENVRLFNELTTRLERERASADVLGVISRSRDDENPVFDTILQNLARLCETPLAFLSILEDDGDHFRSPAYFGEPNSEFVKRLRSFRGSLSESTQLVADALRSGEIIRIDDISDTDLYRDGDKWRVELVDVEGIRSVLLVPLRSGDRILGTIMLYHREVKPFSDDQVALAENFAAQAVIAIENVRQFREVQERLERESATKDILQVISRSRADTEPVIQEILESAARLCNAPHTLLLLHDDQSRQLVLAGSNSAKSAFVDDIRDHPHDLDDDGSLAVRVLKAGEVTHFAYLREAVKEIETPSRQARVATEIEGMRTLLLVPLIQGDRALGVLVLYKLEVAPFSPDEIALVQSFAAQAVIAIENVRQFREVQERLEREKATTDVLGVISRSRDDDLPVFNTILENAARLSGAPLANLCLANEARTHWRLVAHHGEGLRHLTAGQSVTSLDSNLVPGETMRTAKVVHIEDLTDTDLYKSGDEGRVAMVEKEGMRTILGVPLLSGDVAIGCITLFRREVKAFTPDEIALVETFAAQAVIAIENVQQFREVQERLEREQATAQVLSVISRSRDDEVPVFETILENTARLCGADRARLMTVTEDGAGLRAVSQWGYDNPALPEGAIIDMVPEMLPVRSIRERRTINVPDGRETEGYRKGVPQVVANIDAMQARSVLAVPLLKDDAAIGSIVLTSRKINAYDDNDVSLVQTFAEQAVIAIENVRQFKALETLNEELGDRVEEQVGEIERMGRLKRFLPSAVADAVVSAGDDAMLSSHRALIAVLFCDIRGFTAFCETAEPEETIEVLQTYHEEMGILIAEHGAGVDHRSGDGIMVIFNDPLPCDDPAGDAVRMAFAMRDRMAELCKGWKRLGHRLGFGVGISFGYATVGMVGSQGRYDYTASGTAVNLAARLCDRAEDGEVLLSPRAYTAVEDDIAAEPVGELEFKGIHGSVEVFRALSIPG